VLNIVNEPKVIGQQLDLFTPERWPKKPYCSDDKSAKWIRQLKTAIKQPYIQANPPHLRVWMIFDIDSEFAAFAWEDANLPPPTWIVVTTENGHAHIVWGLSAPVLVNSPDMRQKPLRYLCAVEAGFREKLGADQSYSGLITKTPFHPQWRTFYGPVIGYELAELADWVDLPKFLPKRGKNPEEIGLGRNVTLFEWLRQWGYRNIRHYKGEVRNFVYWQAEAYEKALGRNGDFENPLDGRECYHVAKSVARWTWNKFDIAASDARHAARIAATHTSEIQAERGRKSGQARLLASEDKRASARLMHAQGHSIRQIAETLGVGKSTVGDWVSGEPIIR
jgi:hypothetical protein